MRSLEYSVWYLFIRLFGCLASLFLTQGLAQSYSVHQHVKSALLHLTTEILTSERKLLQTLILEWGRNEKQINKLNQQNIKSSQTTMLFWIPTCRGYLYKTRDKSVIWSKRNEIYGQSWPDNCQALTNSLALVKFGPWGIIIVYVYCFIMDIPTPYLVLDGDSEIDNVESYLRTKMANTIFKQRSDMSTSRKSFYKQIW